jgi:hypothetical protein
MITSSSVYAGDSGKRCNFSSECPAGKLMKPHIMKQAEIAKKISELKRQIKELEYEMEIEKERIQIIGKEMRICELKRENPFDGCM